jgi:MEMO1 family protein
MDQSVDENEHSLELHLPFLFKTMSRKSNGSWNLIPILVGQLHRDLENRIANSLLELFKRPSTLFVISTDFCHWGSRFQFNPFNSSKPIHYHIEQLDREGMDLIESLNHGAFATYLTRTRNTICGRNPILLLLKIVEKAKETEDLPLKMEFLEYQQSSRVTRPDDSSVSYASACLYTL